ncbi:MAG TPA: NAD(P)H-dependent oxidoreductase subunit E [Candidatus Aminicenantes bacterium]|nr:NAD(P)H-dependent oxidoreductase subunit E [Candidatus Aminicenantes bacterium]
MLQTRAHTPENPQFRQLREFIHSHRNIPGPLILVLQRAQELFGYLPSEVQGFVAKEMNLPQSEIFSVVTFYNFFRTQPIGDHIINVCLGTACHVKGAQSLLDALADELKIPVGGTTKDGIFTLSTARCFGACGLAPAMMIDEEVFGKLNPDKGRKVIREFRKNSKK